jgi:hypothetical protein
MLLADSIQLGTVLRLLDFTPGRKVHEFAKHALALSVLDLRKALRLQVWTIIRCAYRQITFPSEDEWCRLSLGLENDQAVKDWLRDHEEANEVTAKPGSACTWLLRKPQR